MVRTAAALVSLLVLVGSLAPAYAEKRFALVIGNDRYPNLAANEQLKKAVNDARAVGDALRRLGFEVIRGENLGRQALVDKLDELTRKLSPGDTAFFFFAGHGVAISGGNFILPSDVPNVDGGQETRLARAALGESDIVADLQARGVRVAVVVLDACRNNPFKRPGVRSVGGERGFVRSDPVRGVFSLYSAGVGQTALDRLSDTDGNPNSVFTRVLVPALGKSGLHLSDLAFEVREEVARLAATIGHDQRPASYDETIGGRVYLGGTPAAAAAPPAPVAAPAPPAPRVDPCAAAADHWRSAEAIATEAVFNDHLARFANCPFAGLARARLEALKRQAAVVPPAPPPATPPPPARPAVAAPPAPSPVTPSAPVKPAVGIAPSRAAAVLTEAQERALKPKDTFKECDLCPEMVVVPAGSFTMGSPDSESSRDKDEGPQRTVTIARPFAVAKFEVTVDQYAAFVQASGYKVENSCWTRENDKFEQRSPRSFRNPGFPQTGSHPATCLKWDDAKAYVAWLARTTGKTYRLLSEAEWEYAARAGTKTAYHFGDDRTPICKHANGGDISGKKAVPSMIISDCDDRHAFTAPAGSFPANAFGLHDMLGNVREFVEDCWHSNVGYSGAPTDGSARTRPDKDGICLNIVRGGSWESYYADLRAADRERWSVFARWENGMRVARTLAP
jgi:formylglycine-generating enzyme required for sulfatase activity